MNDDATQPLFHPPVPGTVIRRGPHVYTIGASLGGGAFGGVYECRDEWDNDLAAKVLAPQGTYEQVRRKWIEESQKLVTLRHPNITFVYDAFEYEATFYIIMERCYGSLENIFTIPNFNGELWVIPIARSILQAVNFMHENGYVHKDLHARNILTSIIRDQITPTSAARVFKVADLGVTQVETQIDVFNTALAQWMLPPEYLDPPQFGYVGKATDIYHVGLLLLSLLLGRTPVFSRDEIIAGAPRALVEQLPSCFAGPIGRALRRHVAFRTSSAVEFWTELKAASVSG